MTAPERIWIDAWGGNWSPVSGGTQGIEYIRADLAQPAQVRVKPLVWLERANTTLTSNAYRIGRSYGQGPEPFMVSHGSNIIGWSDSEDGCKRIADQHNRALTLAAIEPYPDHRDDQPPCTCHPDDNPPKPCQQKYALSECRIAARDEVITLAITACRIIDDAVNEGYDTVNGLMMHLLEAVEPARAALAAAKAVLK